MHGAFKPAILALLTVAADQLSKNWALHALARRDIHIAGPISLQLAYNTGFAFSLGTGLGGVLILIIALVLVCMSYVFRHHLRSSARFAAALVFGGALGNLSDRIFRRGGAVVDFIKVGVWPVFNVADSCIVIGVIWIAVLYIRGENAKSRQATKPCGESGLENSVTDGSESKPS